MYIQSLPSSVCTLRRLMNHPSVIIYVNYTPSCDICKTSINARALEKDNRGCALELHFLMRWNKQQNKTYAALCLNQSGAEDVMTG